MGNNKTILVVDDDPHILEVIEARLLSAGYKVHKANSGNHALKALQETHMDLMISDIKMPHINGMDLLALARRIQPDLPVVFLTAYGTIEGAVDSLKAGAVDYLTKPFKGTRLVETVGKILSKPPPPNATDIIASNDDFFVGSSPSMQVVYDVMKRVAGSNVNVLILGESGVGKEYVAKQIHRLSPRRKHPFIVVDCGSTPLSLLESELFGHTKGAFTHAIQDKKGLIAAADHGTLFLDEIGNISAEMQMRLLRFIEDRQIRRVGAIKGEDVDCRIISATNTDLEADVNAGDFREDLYYRVRGVTIQVPPLRTRRADIPALIHHFIERFCKMQRLPMVDLPPETLKWLVDYPWPGNVRELKNAIEGGVVLCRKGVLRPDDFQLTSPVGNAEISSPVKPLTLDENECKAIISALMETGGVQSKAAEILGISRRSIHYKVKKYAIDIAALRNRQSQ